MRAGIAAPQLWMRGSVRDPIGGLRVSVEAIGNDRYKPLPLSMPVSVIGENMEWVDSLDSFRLRNAGFGEADSPRRPGNARVGEDRPKVAMLQRHRREAAHPQAPEDGALGSASPERLACASGSAAGKRRRTSVPPERREVLSISSYCSRRSLSFGPSGGSVSRHHAPPGCMPSRSRGQAKSPPDELRDLARHPTVAALDPALRGRPLAAAP